MAKKSKTSPVTETPTETSSHKQKARQVEKSRTTAKTLTTAKVQAKTAKSTVPASQGPEPVTTNSSSATVVLRDTALTGLSDAEPKITTPSLGAVTAGANLTVEVTTNRTDLSYIVTVTDITPPSRNVLVRTFNVTAPVTDPFTVTIPGTDLPSGCVFRIYVRVDPTAGSTPPHDDYFVIVTT